MGFPDPLTVPIIDFSKLSVGSPKWNLVKPQVKQALEEYGCFEALFPKISVDIRKALLRSLKELFDLPLETKQRLFKEYTGKHPDLPLYESMRISNALVPESMETFTNLLWPQGNADIRETLQSYSEQLSELDQMVRRMVLESLGLEDYMNEHVDSTYYVLRMMKYKKNNTTETNLGIASHTDHNIVTILHQNQVDGLEVQTKDGEWIDVKPSQDSFIVLIGLSLHAWTNGRYHAPHHRVTLRENKSRYTTGLFSIPKGEYIIKAPENIIDEQHPSLFKPFKLNNFFEYYVTSERDISALKTYCGV